MENGVNRVKSMEEGGGVFARLKFELILVPGTARSRGPSTCPGAHEDFFKFPTPNRKRVSDRLRLEWLEQTCFTEFYCLVAARPWAVSPLSRTWNEPSSSCCGCAAELLGLRSAGFQFFGLIGFHQLFRFSPHFGAFLVWYFGNT